MKHHVRLSIRSPSEKGGPSGSLIFPISAKNHYSNLNTRSTNTLLNITAHHSLNMAD